MYIIKYLCYSFGAYLAKQSKTFFNVIESWDGFRDTSFNWFSKRIISIQFVSKTFWLHHLNDWVQKLFSWQTKTRIIQIGQTVFIRKKILRHVEYESAWRSKTFIFLSSKIITHDLRFEKKNVKGTRGNLR